MKKLFLFDIDGTLIKTHSNDRFAQTINNLHDLGVTVTRDYHGWTDQLILAALLEDEGWSDKEIVKAMPALIQELDRIHKTAFSRESVTILPGVVELLKELEKRGETLGLITGNIETIAERKLEAVGIYSYFPLGGFGSDPHRTRADLIKVAITRAGFSGVSENVYVIGDTPRDIRAAQEAGIVNSVGVAHGYRSTQELVDAGARIVLEDLKDTKKVLAQLGV